MNRGRKCINTASALHTVPWKTKIGYRVVVVQVKVMYACTYSLVHGRTHTHIHTYRPTRHLATAFEWRRHVEKWTQWLHTSGHRQSITSDKRA